MIGCVTSCVVKQEEQGQGPEMRKENTPGVTERINDTDTSIGGADVSDAEKAGWTLCVTERSNATDTRIGVDAEKAGSIIHSEADRVMRLRAKSEILSVKVFN